VPIVQGRGFSAAAGRQQRGNAGLAGGAGLLYGGPLAPASLSGMDFRNLGPLEVFDEGGAVMLGGGKQRALLAVFLLHANETLSTDRLIDELWGARPPATAAKTVQVYISRLRKALAGGEGNGPTGVVVTREHGYELKLDPERLALSCCAAPRVGSRSSRTPSDARRTSTRRCCGFTARRHISTPSSAARGMPARPSTACWHGTSARSTSTLSGSSA
jgi:DNA-binding winged helix-turn-helix (wHTH) protein